MKNNNSNRHEMQQEALSRARGGMSARNYAAIQYGFAEKGIHNAEPRVNVLTYNAWQAIGRQVRKGETGVKVQTWIPIAGKKDQSTGKAGETKLRPRSATVFHESQTDEITARKAG